MDFDEIYNIAYQTLLDLACEEGITASARNEVFGCVFGRDTAITVLKILHSHTKKPSQELLEVCERALITLMTLQGKVSNLESGEQPGKFIHEFRKDHFEHLIKGKKRPWYVYPDGFLRNYDSLDSTPLALIALYKYWQVTKDDKFLFSMLPAVEMGLNWVISYGDIDKDYLVEFDGLDKRKSGGLAVQSWTDSQQSFLQSDGSFPKYPIAPIEVQAYCWLALNIWSDFYYKNNSSKFALKLQDFASNMKFQFNKLFIQEDQGYFYGVQALDGSKNPIRTITANPLITLWAAYFKNEGVESILDKKYIQDFVLRAFEEDLFSEQAGIRTMSTKSSIFNPKQDSYHNGSFWPMLNGLIIEGLENFGFLEQFESLKKATLIPIVHFGSPIELYVQSDQELLEYRNERGQVGCKYQAWSAAVILDLV